VPTIKSRRKTGLIALCFHWFMICCTCGLWYPIYASRRRSRVTITHVPDGYPYPPQQYAPQQPGPIPQWTQQQPPPRR
jgi:hypothetical protein